MTMCDCQDPVHCQPHPELVSIRRVPTTVQRTTSSSNYPSFDLTNSTLQLYEQAAQDEVSDIVVGMEDVLVADSDIVFSSNRQPLTNTLSTNLQGLKNAIRRATSLAVSKQAVEDKSTLTTDPTCNKPWQGIEHFLRERNKDTDPETLARPQKPFYKRTWFACVIYFFILLALIAAILALASDRAIVIPNKVLHGEVFPTLALSVSSSSQDSPSTQSLLVPTPSNAITSTKTSKTSDNLLPVFTPLNATTSTTSKAPDNGLSVLDVTSSPPRLAAQLQSLMPVPEASGIKNSSSLQEQGIDWSLLSFPGPLQRSVGNS